MTGVEPARHRNTSFVGAPTSVPRLIPRSPYVRQAQNSCQADPAQAVRRGGHGRLGNRSCRERRGSSEVRQTSADSLADDAHLCNGLNVHAGAVTYEAVATDLNLPYKAASAALAA